jgi:hypothetical protein
MDLSSLWRHSIGKRPQKPLKVFQMYRPEHCGQLSLEDFVLPFAGKLSSDNRWIKLAELIPWDQLEDDCEAQTARRLALLQSPFLWRWVP